jgi:hypothetical protein
MLVARQRILGATKKKSPRTGRSLGLVEVMKKPADPQLSWIGKLPLESEPYFDLDQKQDTFTHL